MNRYIALISLAFLLTTCSVTQSKVAPVPPPLKLPVSRGCADPVAGPNIQISSVAGESNKPVISWTGKTYTIAWWDLRSTSEIYTIRIDAGGVKRSLATALPMERAARDHSIAWDGKEMHLVFLDGGQVKSMRVGRATHPPVTLGPRGKTPTAGPWGSAVWVDRGRLFFRSDGAVEAVKRKRKDEQIDAIVIAAGGITDSTLSWTGDIFAVAWSSSAKDAREIILQRVAPSGALVGPQMAISEIDGSSQKPDIVWNGEEFGIVWLNRKTGADGFTQQRAFFASVPKMATAATIHRELELGDQVDGISIATSGNEYAIAWVAQNENRGTSVYMQRLNLAGEPLGRPLAISDPTPFSCSRPDIVWSDGGYAIVWHDDRSPTGNEVFFSFVTCGPEPEPAPEKAATPAPEPILKTPDEPDPAPGEAPGSELKPIFDDAETR